MKKEKKFSIYRFLARAYAIMIVALCTFGGQPLVGYFSDKIAMRAYKKLLRA